MRLLIGCIGKLGFLIKDLPRPDTRNGWRVVKDEASLSDELRAISLTAVEIREVIRRLRAEGRVVVSCPKSSRRPSSSSALVSAT